MCVTPPCFIDHWVKLLFFNVCFIYVFINSKLLLHDNKSGLWHNATLKIRTTSNK